MAPLLRRQAYPKVKAAGLRALELDPMSAEAHTALGCTAFCFEWDWAGAERAFMKALELEPRYAYGCLWYAWCLTASSRFEEAVGMIRHAIELEPLSSGINGVAGYILSYCGRYDEAVDQCLKTLDLQPDWDTAIDGLGLAYYRKGMLPESLAIYERHELGIIGTQAMRLGTTLAAMGKTEAARRIIAEEEARRAAGSAPGTTGYNVAGILAILGERDQALTWLERDFEDRRFLICLMNIDPRFASLRQEPRFRAMVARMGLPAADP